MAVNLPPPDRASLLPVPGVELGVAMAGVRKQNRKDLLVMRLAPGSAVAGVFTQNRFCAAPVVVAKKHLRNEVQALVVNTGNANAGTGDEGVRRALQVCDALASHLGCEAQEVLPKGLGAETGRLVLDAVRDAGEVSAAECADLVGISRVSARRYLEHYLSTGALELRLQYGVGRPERRYRPAR